MNSLLILQAIFYECTYFNTDNFNLSDLKFFLSKKIPVNIHLPSSNYELVALRCFFFYELLLEFLKLKTVKTNLDHLKKSVNLQLSVVNYKAITKESLIYGLNGLQEALSKIEIKYNDFHGKKSADDKETDINKGLVFYNKVEDEIQILIKKTTNLIDNKYINLTKMRQMLAIIVNESYLPKFLKLFNAKIGNDFFLNKIGKPDHIETNQEALNYLFHAICRDEFHTPLNTRINLFINELTEAYSKDDISVLDSIELEDLIEFSFYYIFTLLYTDYNSRLKGFNNKLLYTELIALGVYTNIKLKALQVLENRKNEEINKFLEKIFKNKVDYDLQKKNILEEIKLNLEVIIDIKRIVSDSTSLERSLIEKLKSSLVPMPEKNLLMDSLKSLEKKQKICELEYQKIEKLKFINKSIKKCKSNEAFLKKSVEMEYQKATECFSVSLNCLSENLAISLKHIKEHTQDINRFRQKISSSVDQIDLSIQTFLSSLNSWKSSNDTQDLATLSLPKILEQAEKFVIKNSLIKRKDHKKKLTKLQLLLNNCSLSIELLIDQVGLIINKYHSHINAVKEILNLLSTSFTENHSRPQFFVKSLTKKIKRQNRKLSNDYIRLKEQSNGLEKIIRLIKCDTDIRVLKLYTVIVEADDFQKTYELLNEKILTRTFPKSKQTFSAIKEKNSSVEGKGIDLADSIQLIERVKDEAAGNSNGAQMEKVTPVFTAKCANGSEPLNLKPDLASNQEPLNDEKKLTDENKLIEESKKNLSNANPNNINLLKDYETWNLEFEKWKGEKHTRLYELFHIIESCSKSVLYNSDKAFLKCLALYQKEFFDKNNELKEKANQINLYFKSSNHAKIMISYLFQYQKWFDEIFQRIIFCRTLIFQNEDNPIVQESPRLPSSLADNRAEFKSLLTFYLGATDRHNKFRDDLIREENKLNNLNRSFIKQILMLGSLDGMDDKDNVLSDFSKQLDRVNQLKLAIEQEFETKHKMKEKLSLIASPEIVKFYLSRIDPHDADSLKNPTQAAGCAVPMTPQVSNACAAAPTMFYCMPQLVSYPDVVDPRSQIFYSM